MIKLKFFERYLLMFLVGGFGYGTMEIGFRGFTHWSMVITGGSAFLCLYLLNEALTETPILVKSIIGALIITAMELSVGLVVNKMFNFAVWDYTNTPANFLGIISLPFTACWCALSFAILILFNVSKKLLNSRNSKYLNTVGLNINRNEI